MGKTIPAESAERGLARTNLVNYIFSMKKYAFFDHTADIGMEICGRTKKELFSHAAESIREVLLVGGGQKTHPGVKKTITVDGLDSADLLVNFLREILYLFNGQGMIVYACRVLACGSRTVVAELHIVPFSPETQSVKTELKAVTYSGLHVEKTKNGWKARVIFDV